MKTPKWKKCTHPNCNGQMRDGYCPACHRTEQKPSDERFQDVLKELADLHAKKGADYGRGVDPLANLRASAEFGIPPWQGVLLRMNDKMHRLKSLVLNGKLANEPAEDSLLDMAAYSVLALILLREERTKNESQGLDCFPGKIPARHGCSH